MMPSDTVDLPQPDSPTMPIASPGMTVQEKSMTAGISPLRVKKEIDRFSISMIGSLFGPLVGSAGFRTASFMGRSNPGSFSISGREPVHQSFIDCSRSESASRLRPSTNDISAIVGGSAGWMKERSRRLASLIAVPQSGLSGASPRPK